MKKGKLSVLVALVCSFAALCVFAACAPEESEHTHTYGAWTITKEPTLEAGGKAQRKCTANDDGVDTKDLPALTDTTVWTKDAQKSTPAGHATPGSDVYTSEYGDVTVTVAATGHTYGDWTITKDPTLTEQGKAKHDCTESDEGTETVDIPALNDSKTWTRDDGRSTPAGHATPGSDVYTSEYGDVTVTVEATGHTYGAWTITKDPTLTEKGEAKHDCTENDGGTDTVDIPALSDSETWTRDDDRSTPAGHATPGSDVYTSEYGDVTVTVEATGHTYGDWTITKDPTLTEQGKAKHDCTESDGGTETVDIPALNDSETWTKGDETVADYNHGGSVTYSSVYGEVTLTSPKIEAPYDNKTYGSVEIDIGEDGEHLNGAGLLSTSWTEARLTLDANSSGEGSAAPFTVGTKITFRMVDPATGEIEIEFIYGSWADGDDGREFTPKVPESKKTVKGYVNMETGYVIMANSSSALSGFSVLIPADDMTDDTALRTNWKVSAWGESTFDYSIAASYETQAGATHTFFVRNDVAHFGVTFTDLAGESVAANECYHNSYVYVKKGTETLASFGYYGDKMVVLDGIEGTYTAPEGAETGDLFLSGFGTLTLNGKSGTYTALDGGKLGIIVAEDGGDVYYETTVGDGSYTALDKIMVTVHYHYKGFGGTDGDVQYNKNIPVALATPKEEEVYLFRGWFTDEDCTQPVDLGEGKYTPTAEVHLYAKWEEKLHVLVYLEGEGDEAPVTVYGSEEDLIVEKLNELLNSRIEGLVDNAYDEEGGRVLQRWYTKQGDDEFNIEESMQFDAGADGASIYADWAPVPAYMGDYKGANLDASHNVYYSESTYHIAISWNKTVSGKFSGTVSEYTDQLITVTSGSSTYYFIFDEATGTLATSTYNSATSTSISGDMAFYSKNGMTADDFKRSQAMHTPNPANPSSSQGYYARFVLVKDAQGSDVLVLLYGSHIYSDITVKNAFGDVLPDIATIFDSKTVIVYDNSKDGAVVIARAAAQTVESGDTKDLDSYYGAYTKAAGSAGTDTLKLDGAGAVKWGEYEGSYAKAEAGDSFDVFVTEGETKVYYSVTLDLAAKTYTAEKVMVNVTLDVDDLDETIAAEWTDKSVNKNIEIILPTPTSDTHVFRGWFTDSDCLQEVSKNDDGAYYIVPTDASTTVHAKWLEKVTLTIHYNDGTTEDKTVEYGKGETAEVERPMYAGHGFNGWFTDDTTFAQAWGTMDDDTHITSAEMTANVDIYAKWGKPPIYSGSFKLYYYNGTTANGGTDNGKENKIIFIDEVGNMNAVTGAAYPFAQNLLVTEYNDEDGTLTFARESSKSSTFSCFIDKTTGIIVFIARGITISYSDIFILVPETYAEGMTATGAHWDSGKTRVIRFAKAEETFGIYLADGEAPHFGVTFTDMDGEEISNLSDGYKTDILYVHSGDEIIARWGFNGTTMVGLDGNEGTYTLTGGDTAELGSTLLLDGIGKATFGDKVGTYTVAEDKDWTLDVYVDGKYIRVTLAEATYSYDLPMVQITFTSDQTPVEAQTVNVNIPIVLPTPTNDNYVFRGWFTDSAYQEPVALDTDGKYTPTAATVLYAKWLTKVTITVHYGNDLPDGEFVYGVGEAGNPNHPGYTKGQVWDGWYTSQNYLEGELWKDGTAVDADLELWCKWIDAVAMYGDWVGRNVYGASGNGSGSNRLKVSAEGVFSVNKDATLESYDPVTGRVIAKRNTYSGWYYGSYDVVNQILILNDDSETDPFFIDNDIDVFVKGTTMTVSNGMGVGNSNKDRIFTVSSDKISATDVLVYNGRVYGKVVFKTPGGGVMTITQVLDTKTTAFSVYSSTGEFIANFKKDSGSWVSTDGYEGSYTVEGGTVVLDGKGGITYTVGESEKTGTYTLAPLGSDYTFDVYLEEGTEYYELTVRIGESDCTLTKANVNITFTVKDSTTGLTQDTQSYNKNVPVLLPTPENDTEVGTGWFTDEACTTPVTLDENGRYTPTEDVTLYTKAAEKLTLTIVWGDHGPEENTEVPVPKGTTPDLTPYIPEADGEFVFDGWYEDASCATVYTPAPLTESKTIYCKWLNQPYKVELQAIKGSKNWTESEGVYTYSGGMSNSDIIAIVITFSAAGEFTFDWEAEMGEDSYIVCAVNPTSTSTLWSSGYKEKGSYSVAKAKKSVTVAASDTVYILIYDFYGSSESAQVSNFKFTPNA